MNETKCLYVRNGLANFTVIRKNKIKELIFQQLLFTSNLFCVFDI